MTITSIKDRRGEKGFTLVELAIVLIIVGLLITGVLKGQELIANAEVASTASTVRAFDAGISTFRDSFAAFPGDMPPAQAQARIPGCAGCVGGNGNGRLTSPPGTSGDTAEQAAFWLHMVRADMITGDTTGANPDSNLNGFYSVGYHPGGNLAIGGGNIPAAHFVVISDVAAGTGDTVPPEQAARLDRKIDDGVGNTGSVQASSGDGCVNGAGVYNEAVGSGLCRMVVATSN